MTRFAAARRPARFYPKSISELADRRRTLSGAADA